MSYSLRVSFYRPIFEALNAAGSRYVVVGGFAVVLRGYARLTSDIDLFVDLAPAEAARTISALTVMGMRPRSPVAASDFADPQRRADWIATKQMVVFSLWDPNEPMREVDLFVSEPIPFAEVWARATDVDVGGLPIKVASTMDLIELKRRAARPQDLLDIEALEAILSSTEPE